MKTVLIEPRAQRELMASSRLSQGSVPIFRGWTSDEDDGSYAAAAEAAAHGQASTLAQLLDEAFGEDLICISAVAPTGGADFDTADATPVLGDQSGY